MTLQLIERKKEYQTLKRYINENSKIYLDTPHTLNFFMQIFCLIQCTYLFPGYFFLSTAVWAGKRKASAINFLVLLKQKEIVCQFKHLLDTISVYSQFTLFSIFFHFVETIYSLEMEFNILNWCKLKRQLLMDDL